MKKLFASILMVSILLALLLAGCSVEDPTDPTGTVNPPTVEEAGTPYVAIGNSLTAGFMDGGLMVAGQGTSYPALIAMQLGMEIADLTQDGAFYQPFVNAPGIGSSDVGEGMVSGVLYYDGTSPVPLGVTDEDDVLGLLLAATVPVQYGNLGVPGARLSETRTAFDRDSSFGAPYGAENPFFDFINRASFFGNMEMIVSADPLIEVQTASQLWQAISRGPALATLWLGANDILAAAMSGEPESYPFVTDPVDFGIEFGNVLGTLANGLVGRNGLPGTIVCGTVPSVSNSAYFLPLANFEAVFGAWPYEEGNDPVTGVRYILFLDFLSWFDPLNPDVVPANLTLDAGEVAYLGAVTDGYNTGITTAAGQIDALGLADVGIMNADDALDALDPEQKLHFMYLRLIHPTDTMAETAARTYFSLDGIHPNNMGYAYVAGRFMTAITATNSDYAFSPPPPAAFTWDPEYTLYGGAKAIEPEGGLPRVAPEVVAGIKSLFR